MSLVGTLGRMAVGVMVAKGVGKMLSNRQAGGRPMGGGGGLGGMLGGLLGGQGGAQGGATRTGGGGLAGGLGGMLGGASGSRPGGGLGDLGAMLGGRTPSGGAAGGGALAGGLGGLLERIGGGNAPGAGATSGTSGAGEPSPSGGSFGDLLNRSLADEPIDAVDPGQEEHAKLMIRAMINAAKSDGRIDETERERIVEHIGDDATAEDREFVLSEMRAPLDVDAFVRSVPRGAEREVYTMSLMGIDLDEQAEARYLDALRKGMNLSEADANAIHEQLGVPTLYS